MSKKIAKNENMDLSWLINIEKQLPEPKVLRRNFFEIIGYPTKESVNSNLLAYYLDKEQDHGFKDLFFQSLLDVMEELSDSNTMAFNRDDYLGDYTVQREARAEAGWVDILIEESGSHKWAIVIENKIFHHSQNNDFQDYLLNSTQVNSEDTRGVLLTLNEVNGFEEMGYINITHQNLINKVKENLHQYYDDADVRHLLLLKEYIANMNQFYNNQNTEIMVKLDKIMSELLKYSVQIAKLKNTENEVLGELNTFLFNHLQNYGLEPRESPKGAVGTIHFYFTDEPGEEVLRILNLSRQEFSILKKHFRFWVIIGELRSEPVFKAYFETFNKEDIRHARNVREKLKASSLLNDKIKIGKEEPGKTICHLYDIAISFDEDNFTSDLIKQLDEQFFKHQNGFLKKPAQIMAELQSEQ